MAALVPKTDLAVILQDSPGSLRSLLVAYFSPATADQDAMTAAARKRLPQYMVPVAFVPLGSIPRLPTGKVRSSHDRVGIVLTQHLMRFITLSGPAVVLHLYRQLAGGP